MSARKIEIIKYYTQFCNYIPIKNDKNRRIEISYKNYEIKDKNNDLSKIICKVDNTLNRTINFHHKIWEYVQDGKEITKGYNKNSIDIFSKEVAKEALFLYLYNGSGGQNVDKELTNNYRDKGWSTSATLSYLRIETNKVNRGIMKNVESSYAKKIINSYIDENY